MPLYARTEKRLKRKEREDELGITAVKAAMKENGELEDGDSDSDDGSISGESSEDGEEEDEEEDEDEDENENEMSGEDDGDEDSDEDGDEEADEEMASEADSETFPLTIDEIESNPIYPLEGHEGCLLCPGKLLKHAQMRETHIASAPHKRAMKRWKARLAEVDTRPLPLDDPRDVMNEILDDLEDRRTNTLPTTSTPAENSTTTTEKAEETTKPKTDSPLKDGRKRKNRRGRSKAERKEQKAQEALKGVEAGETVTPVVANGHAKSDEKGETKEGGKGRALNRRARRLLAKQAAGQVDGKVGKPNGQDKTKSTKTNGTSKSTKSTKSPNTKTVKEDKIPKEKKSTTSQETAPVEEVGKEKKRRKRNSEAKKTAAVATV